MQLKSNWQTMINRTQARVKRTSFATVRKSGYGPLLHLMQCRDMSAIGAKPEVAGVCSRRRD